MVTTRFGFPELLQPMAMPAFFEEYWEKKPLHLSRRDPHFYDGLFATSDVDVLLSQSRPRYPQLRVVSKDKPLPAQQLLQTGWLHPVIASHIGDAKVTSLYSAYSEGYTLIVELEKLWRPVSMLCRNMDEQLHHKATAELYLTPQGAQGFDLHYDHHEVFILQIAGAKRWQVHAPVVPIPVTEERVNLDQIDGPPLVDTVVEAGDVLYIPRGFPHQGFTSDQYSLHITFGVFVYRWQHLLVEALKELTERDVRFRQALPIAFLKSGAHTEAVRARMGELLRALADDHRPDAALEQLSTSYLRKLEPIPDGHFGQINLLNTLASDSRVEKRVGSLCYVSRNNGTATIHFPGSFVAAPDWLEPTLRYICDAPGSFTVASLPDDMDADGKVVLARRLVKEGLLRVVAD